jgi:hypothetical protein
MLSLFYCTKKSVDPFKKTRPKTSASHPVFAIMFRKGSVRAGK